MQHGLSVAYFFIKSSELCKLWARVEIEMVVVVAAVVSAAVVVVNFLVFHPIVC